MLELTTEPIELDALVRDVRTDACGAVVAFAGVVRETSPDDSRRVERIRYEAYPALALPQLNEIAGATRRAFGPLEIAIVHRTGELVLGDISVAIVVAALIGSILVLGDDALPELYAASRNTLSDRRRRRVVRVAGLAGNH